MPASRRFAAGLAQRGFRQAGFRGRVIRKAAPAFGLESTVMEPPCLRMAVRVTKRPIPAPLLPFVELNS